MVLRVLIGGVVLPLQATLLVAVPGAGATGATVGPAPAAALSAEEQAFAEAVASGEPVEIADLRQTHSQTFANPDGYTMTQETVAAPRFGKNVSGGLVPIDTTLVRTADGIRPAASAVDTTFPSAGEQTVSFAHQDSEFSIGLLGNLPEPTLTGPTATYAEVLPGVDLKLTAVPEGFRQVYVVKNRQAAQSAAFDRIVQPVQSSTGRILPRTGGGSLFVDELGETVFSSATAMMWESGGTSSAVAAADSAEPARPADVAPSTGAEWREMPVDVAAAALTVTPNQQLLEAADTIFPVYIDPTLGINLSAHSMLRSDGYSDWQFKDDEGVGRCPIDYGSGFRCGREASGRSYAKRLYYEFGRGRLNGGDHVLHASFAVEETWAMSCVETKLDIVRTDPIRASAKWPGPRVVKHLATVTEAAGHGPNCVGKEIAVSNGAITTMAKALAAGKSKRVTIGLRAHDENDQWGWKRFAKAAVLRVVYVRKPGKPTGVGWKDGADADCATYDERMWVSWQTPTMRATVQTAVNPKDNRKGALRAQFHLQRHTDQGEWVNVLGTDEAPYKARPEQGWAQDGDAQAIWLADLGRQLLPGHVYRMRARTMSHYGAWDDSGNTQPGEIYSRWSDWCHVEYDPDPPAAPIVTTADHVYEEEINGVVRWGGGPGVPGRFNYAPNPDDDDGNVVGYDTQVVGARVEKLASGSRVTPREFGPLVLKVRAKDAAGHASDWRHYRFNVRPPTPEAGIWKVTASDGPGPDGTTLIADSSADPNKRHPLRLSSPSILDKRLALGRQAGRTDRSLSFDLGEFGRTEGPVIDTSKSFGFGAWTMLASGAADRTVLGQFSSDKTRGIQIRYVKASDTWSLQWLYPGGIVTVNARPGTRVSGSWTHLLGVYDAGAKQLQLYLNGQLAGSKTVSGVAVPTVTDGNFMVGRSSLAEPANYWGRLDEIRVWNSVITPETALLRSSRNESDGRSYLSLIANWSATASMRDTSAYGRADAALNDGAVIEDGAVKLNGAGAYLGMAGPVVDDTGSFTASAAFSLDKAALVHKAKGHLVRVLGQQGTVDGGMSSWALWFEKVNPAGESNVQGYWRVGRWSAPGSGRPPAVAATDDPEHLVDLDDHQNVTIVYDHEKQQVFVYDGDTLLAYINYVDPSYGTGRLLAGWGPDQPGNFMPGRVTGIRLWAGAMSEQDVVEIVNGE